MSGKLIFPKRNAFGLGTMDYIILENENIIIINKENCVEHSIKSPSNNIDKRNKNKIIIKLLNLYDFMYDFFIQ